jgi:hypothetical protein
MDQSEPQDAAVVAGMVCAGAVTAQFVAAKATRDALFLANAEVTALPMMVAITAALSIGLVVLTSWALRRRAPGLLVPGAFAFSGLLLLASWLLVERFPVPVALAVYLQISGLGPILGSGFWLLASERFNPRSARRHYGQIAGVGTLAGLGGALLAERVGAVAGVNTMLPVLAVLNVFCAVAVWRFAPAEPVRQPHAMDETPELDVQSPGSGVRALIKVPYLQNLAALVFLGTIAATVVDYVFKLAAVDALGRGETLLRFFAIYYAATSLLTFIVQATVSRISLERFGLGATAGTPSLALVVGGLGGLLFPGLPGAMAARGGESVLRGSLFKVGYEIFFTPIQPQDKRAAKSIIDVGFDRLGDAVGAAVVAILLRVSLGEPSRVLLVAAVVCSGLALFAARRLNRGYIQTLEQNLMHRAVELDLEDVTDLTTRTAMLRTLRSSGLGVASRTREERERDPTGFPLDDPEIRAILALRSRDVSRIRPVLAQEGLPATLIPHTIALLAWDPVAEEVVTALKRVAEEHVGQFVDALVDPNQPFAVRRRLARVFGVCVSQRAADALLVGLDDLRFEVRFHCGRSLAAIVERSAFVRIDAARVFDIVRREVAVGRPVWEGNRLLDEADGGRFVDMIVKRRAGQSLAHVFTLLSLVLPSVPLQVAYKGLQTDDRALRGTALEYLEGVLPRDIRDRLWPFLGDDVVRPQPSVRSREQVLDELLRSNESIMINLQELRQRMTSQTSRGDA